MREEEGYKSIGATPSQNILVHYLKGHDPSVPAPVTVFTKNKTSKYELMTFGETNL